MSYRKIHFNAWKDPETIRAAREGREWLSPHCSSGACRYCAERRRRRQAAATRALEAATAPGMFWDSKIDRGQDQLGPSAPDAWIQTSVKEPGIQSDVLGYWPRRAAK